METEASALAKALMQETVWLKQDTMVKAEAAFREMSLKDTDDSADNPKVETQTSPLSLETVWFRQQTFEDAEAWCAKVSAGTADFSTLKNEVIPGTPTKRSHIEEYISRPKKLKPGDSWEKKLLYEISTLNKSSTNLNKKLDEFQKNQDSKVQAIQDTVLQLNNAIEACQNRLCEELSTSSSRLIWFRDLIKDVDSVISKTTENISAESWGKSSRLPSFCKAMSEGMSKIEINMKQCFDSCHGFQADVPKADMNKIVGEVGKLSLFKKKQRFDKFEQKKSNMESVLQDITSERYNLEQKSYSSDTSDDENVSSSNAADSDNKDTNQSKKKLKPNFKGKKTKQNKNQPQLTGVNRNNQNSTALGRNGPRDRPTLMSQRPHDNYSTPKKRNSQGSQSIPQRGQDVFTFRGTQSGKSPLLRQPGILGPRPGEFSQPEVAPHNAFRYQQNFNPSSVQSMGAMQNPHGGYPYNNFGFNMQQNAGNIQSRGIQNFQQGSGVSNGFGINNPLKQSKLYQYHNMQGSQSSRPEFGYQTSPGRYGFGSNIEEQLNEIGQKLRQMQLVAGQDCHLQQLMAETQRLKQVVTHSQRSQQQHHHHDHFQQQFQILINAFLQQQQMQQQQQPPQKLSKSMPSHQQRTFHNRQHQFYHQKQKKQQQNKHQMTKQENYDKEDSPTQTQYQKGSPKGSPHEKKGKSDSSPPNKSSKLDKALTLSKQSRLTRIGMFNPSAQGDKHRAGVSSMVLLEELGCLVVVDIINSCLKLYDVNDDGSSRGTLNHRLVTRLGLPRPYYMTQLSPDTVVVSRAGNTLSVVKVTKRRLEFLRDLTTKSQYYGLAYIEDGIIACAAFNHNKINMVSIQDDNIETTSLTFDANGPELVSSMACNKSIVYVERAQDHCIKLRGIGIDSGEDLFSVNLDSETSNVWNLACVGERIICSNKQGNKLKLFSKSGMFLADLATPGGTVKNPFGLAFSRSGNMYVANDSAYDEQYNHHVTTEINVFNFS